MTPNSATSHASLDPGCIDDVSISTSLWLEHRAAPRLTRVSALSPPGKLKGR